MKNPNNYRIQKSCINCAHCFIYEDYDEKDFYYCNIKKDRPLSGSTYLNEDHESKKVVNTWLKWSKNHQVSPDWICDKYKGIE